MSEPTAPSHLGSDPLERWVGREATLNQTLELAPVQALAATLDVPTPGEGDALPPGWQWLFFNPVVAAQQLGPDGHPRRDGAGDGLLPGGLPPRRMWAGSRIRYLAPVTIGARATRTERVLRIAAKQGRSGRMVFVTVLRSVHLGSQLCVEEEQDIVFRDPVEPAAGQSAAPPSEPAPEAAVEWHRVLCPDPVLLFRYSALTFNGHRIHYDLPYARDVEGYSGLVVHGPLVATLMQQFAQECGGTAGLQSFEFQCLRPLLAQQSLELQAWHTPGQVRLLEMRALDVHGALAVRARAELKPK